MKTLQYWTIIIASSQEIGLASSFTTSISSSSLVSHEAQRYYHRSRCTSSSLTPLQTLKSKNNQSKFKFKFKFHCRSKSKTSSSTTLFFASSNNNESKKASVSLSSDIISPSSQEFNSPTAIIDYIISLLTSDIGSIIIGSIGLLLALYNRLSTIDFDSTTISTTYAESINIQSRNDLLAVFASGAVLLNGISKLDVTSALAESVILNGYTLTKPIFINQDYINQGLLNSSSQQQDLEWAIESILSSTPAKTAVILKASSKISSLNTNNTSNWIPVIMAGTVPLDFKELEPLFLLPEKLSTPILDRFLKQDNAKESYLPTLQALPGKVEFTYLPDNAQEALLLPIQVSDADTLYALVVGSNTAKSFSPRDIAWCQVIAKRTGDKLISYYNK